VNYCVCVRARVRACVFIALPEEMNCRLNIEVPNNYYSLLFTNEYTSECLKNNVKIYIKIAPTCFGGVTPSSGSSLSVLAEDTLR
jgi:hypothetical protein